MKYSCDGCRAKNVATRTTLYVRQFITPDGKKIYLCQACKNTWETRRLQKLWEMK